jgi:hypothetical protein
MRDLCKWPCGPRQANVLPDQVSAGDPLARPDLPRSPAIQSVARTGLLIQPRHQLLRPALDEVPSRVIILVACDGKFEAQALFAITLSGCRRRLPDWALQFARPRNP